MSLSSILGTVGLIAVACYEIYQHWEQITAWAQKAGEAISSIDTSKIQAVKAGTLSRSDVDYGVLVMSSTYMPPSIKNATGGIYTRPIWTWAAEKGAEAIIPLTDKSRGIPLLMQAANILGLTQPDTPAITATPLTDNAKLIQQANEIGVNNNAGRNFNVSGIRSGDTVNTSWPSVNLTVNITGDSQDMSIAERIKQAVIDAMNEITSRQERLSYA